MFRPSPTLATALISNPDAFMAEVARQPDPFSVEFARTIDQLDPIGYTANEFRMGEVIPFAGHSLGPLFKPTVNAMLKTLELQATGLHEGHFQSSHPEGKEHADWFRCDEYIPGMNAAREIIGFKENREFIFTANGLSDNLAKVLDTLYRPGLKHWQSGKTRIVMLGGEFFSDQAVVTSVVERAIDWAQLFECAEAAEAKAADHIIRIPQDENQQYSTETIIATVKANADKIKMICLSDIVFMTGQRLDLQAIFKALKETIESHHIIVGLDLAHTVGNRPVDLENFPVQISFAVGCGYKHLSGPAGSGFGLYVNRHVDLKKNHALQGWKAADPNRVFPLLNSFDASIMAQSGAAAFRISNPPPLALHPVQTYLTYFAKVGFEKCFNKSEALTRYLIMQLRHHLGEHIEMITSDEPEKRGAMIVFRLKEAERMDELVEQLRHGPSALGCFEIDTRAPNIRLTAHYGYTKFEHICQLVMKMKLVLENRLTAKLRQT